ncbi:MAG: hypothetical protein PHH83_02665 [Patescibacteria group bacterium]|nr:hypothetical protein [Patescibacteria group bacterium]
MQKIPWIRIVYLYLMTTIGLIVFVIGSITMLNSVLKTFVFKKADMNYYSRPSELYLANSEKQVTIIKECSDLTVQDKEMIDMWLADYQNWKKIDEGNMQITSQRQRNFSNSIAMIVIGFPLYFIHWNIIKKERKKDEEII